MNITQIGQPQYGVLKFQDELSDGNPVGSKRRLPSSEGGPPLKRLCDETARSIVLLRQPQDFLPPEYGAAEPQEVSSDDVVVGNKRTLFPSEEGLLLKRSCEGREKPTLRPLPLDVPEQMGYPYDGNETAKKACFVAAQFTGMLPCVVTLLAERISESTNTGGNVPSHVQFAPLPYVF